MPGPEVSVMKLAISDHMERTGDLLMAIEGPHGTLGASRSARPTWRCGSDGPGSRCL
jgi:hypothetical protein